MKVLITGSSGFIGKNLVVRLSKSHSIIALSHKKILKKNKNIKYIYLKKKKILNLKKVDAIIHCAASTPPKYSQNECYKNNRYLDNLIISFYKNYNIKKFIYLSSMSVYGKIKNKIVKENDRPKNLDLYGMSKFETEKNYSRFKKIIIDQL